MLFNSLHFAIFFPIVFGLYWFIPHKFRWFLLLISSYYFYMSWNVKYVVLILFTTAVSFFAALLIEKNTNEKIKKLILSFALMLCLGVLFIFKYFNFFTETTVKVLKKFSISLHPVTLSLILPVGISFYTFQTLSYVIDVYRGTVSAEHHLGIYATFISFFPQLVAGPIERTNSLLPQIKTEHHFDPEKAFYGLRLMIWGFFKKIVIADTLAEYVDQIYGYLPGYEGFSFVLAAIFFAIQIYCDFSGYSDIAKGTAKLLGIELMDNFRSPYFATTIKQFWRKWHISLSTWFRDYIYIPIGGNRDGKLKHYLNIFITFSASGLWHGANLTFIAWGMLHSFGQIFEDMCGIKPYKGKNKLILWSRYLLVFLFVVFAFILFRSPDLVTAKYVISHLFTGINDISAYVGKAFIILELTAPERYIPIISSLLILSVFDYFNARTDVIYWIGTKEKYIQYPVYLLFILYIIVFRAIGEVNFIYFQF